MIRREDSWSEPISEIEDILIGDELKLPLTYINHLESLFGSLLFVMKFFNASLFSSNTPHMNKFSRINLELFLA